MLTNLDIDNYNKDGQITSRVKIDSDIIADENAIEVNGIEFADGSENFQSQYTKSKNT